MFIIVDQKCSQDADLTIYGLATVVSVVPTIREAARLLADMYGLSGQRLIDYFARDDKAPYRSLTADRTTAVSVFQRDLH